MAMSVVYATVNGILVEEERGGVVTCYVRDTLGSVIKTTDSTGNITSSISYWPFGDIRSSVGINPSPWFFCGTLGYYQDSLTRLYVRARFYLASLGRWLTVDPLWPSTSAYKYASNCPTTRTDRTGLLDCLEIRNNCLDDVDNVRNWCVHLAHEAYLGDAMACRSLPRLLQRACFLAAHATEAAVTAACYTAAEAAQLACLNEYALCLGAAGLLTVIIGIAIICELCPACCLVPVLASDTRRTTCNV